MSLFSHCLIILEFIYSSNFSSFFLLSSSFFVLYEGLERFLRQFNVMCWHFYVSSIFHKNSKKRVERKNNNNVDNDDDDDDDDEEKQDIFLSKFLFRFNFRISNSFHEKFYIFIHFYVERHPKSNGNVNEMNGKCWYFQYFAGDAAAGAAATFDLLLIACFKFY